MTRYIVKGFTACNQHLFTKVVEAPTKTMAGSGRGKSQGGGRSENRS